MLESWTQDKSLDKTNKPLILIVFKLVWQASTPPQELEFTFLGCNNYWLCRLELGTHSLWANKRLIRASLLSPGLHWVLPGKELGKWCHHLLPSRILRAEPAASVGTQSGISFPPSTHMPHWWEKHHPKSQKQNSFLARRQKGRMAVPIAVNLHQVQVQSEVYPDTYYLFTQFILKLLFESRSHFLQALSRQPLAIIHILLVKLSSAALEQIDTVSNVEPPTCLYEYDT